MYHPNLSKSVELIRRQLASHPEQFSLESNRDEADNENYNQLYKRVTKQALPKKTISQEKKGLSYIDKSISSINNQNGSSALSEKLIVMRNKFFKTLTKNYKPRTPRSREKSPNSYTMTTESDSFVNFDSRGNRKSSLQKSFQQEQKKPDNFYNEDVYRNMEDEQNLTTGNFCSINNEKESQFVNNRYDNRREKKYTRNNEQSNKENRHKEDEPREGRYFFGNSRSLSSNNLHKKENDSKNNRSTTPTNLKQIASSVSMTNLQDSEEYNLPTFKQSSLIEENCNYAYIKNFKEELERTIFAERDGLKPNNQVEPIPIETNFMRGKLSAFNHGQADPFTKKEFRSFTQTTENTETSSRERKKSLNDQKDFNKVTQMSRQGDFPPKQEIWPDHKSLNTNKTISDNHHPFLNGSKENSFERTQPITKLVNSNGYPQSLSEEFRLRTLSQVTDRFDHKDELYTKQKACLSLSLVLNHVTFKKLNLAYQYLKTTMENASQQTTQPSSEKDIYTREDEGFSGLMNHPINNSIMKGLLKLSSLVGTINTSLNRVKQSAFDQLHFNALTAYKQEEIMNIQEQNQMTLKCLALRNIIKSQCRSQKSQAFSHWKSITLIESIEDSARSQIQQLKQAFYREKMQLMEELFTLREKTHSYEKEKMQFMEELFTLREKAHSHEKEKTQLMEELFILREKAHSYEKEKESNKISSFMQSMKSPNGPINPSHSYQKEEMQTMEELFTLREKVHSYEKEKETNKLSSFLQSMKSPDGPINPKQISATKPRIIHSKTPTREVDREKENTLQAASHTWTPVIMRPKLDLNEEEMSHTSKSTKDEIREQNKLLYEDLKRQFEQQALKQRQANHQSEVQSINTRGEIYQNDKSYNQKDSFNSMSTREAATETNVETNCPSLMQLPQDKYSQKNVEHSSSSSSERYRSEKELILHNGEDLINKVKGALDQVFKDFKTRKTVEFEDKTTINKETYIKSNRMRSEEAEEILGNLKQICFERNADASLSQEPKSFMSIEQSEILNERNGEMKGIKNISKDFILKDLDDCSMICSEGSLSNRRKELQ